MPVQNCNSRISSHPDFATKSTLNMCTNYSIFNSLLCQNIYRRIDNLYFKSVALGRLQKGNLHFSRVLDDSLLVKYFVITPKKSKLKILFRNSCLSKKEVFRICPSKIQKGMWVLAKSLSQMCTLRCMCLKCHFAIQNMLSVVYGACCDTFPHSSLDLPPDPLLWGNSRSGIANPLLRSGNCNYVIHLGSFSNSLIEKKCTIRRFISQSNVK